MVRRQRHRHRRHDHWTNDGLISQGQMFSQNVAGSIVTTLGTDTVFLFNHDGDRIVVADPPAGQTARGLATAHEFTVAARVRWAGAPPGTAPGTRGVILTKGPRHDATYALTVDVSGHLRASIYRHVFEKRWGWLFGWVDDLAADNSWDEVTELVATGVLSTNTWVNVVATVNRDRMVVYVDGVVAAERVLDYYVDSGSILTHHTTDYLIGNDDPLRLGVDQAEAGFTPDGRFFGHLDNVQYFLRALTTGEVQQLHLLGACPN